MKIAQIFTIYSILVFLLIGCSEMKLEKIEFVKNGVPIDLLDIDGCEQKDGYLQSTGGFNIGTGQVLYGDEFEVRIKLSIGSSKGHIIFVIADNTFGFTNEFGNEDEKAVFLFGPSISRTVALGKMSKFVTEDRPFELLISFQNDILTYSIDGKELYSEKAVVKPAGMIRLNEYTEEFRLYDLIVTGQLKPKEEFYNREFILNRSQASVDRTAKQVKDDPNRPAYHFQPPANWNNDPNGMLYYGGYYHMFYQHNPYADIWDWMHWGHARSKDLVHWEHLPIALWPSVERGELHCFSGSGFIMDNGKPILFYTSIGHENPEHWAAVPVDDELIEWKKHPQNPLLVMEDHDGQHIDDWRDPFLFRENGETYMVIGGHPRGEKGSIMMYEALNPELTEWRYLGSPFSGEEGNWECPNFFKVEDKYVLIYSPHGQVEYYIGDLDIKNMRFTSDTHGVIDNGGIWNYYAPNTLQMDNGRRLLFGWIGEFKKEQGWQGAISLPRDLTLNQNNQLIQKPVPELVKLRGKNYHKTNVDLGKNPLKIDISKPQFEFVLNLGDDSAKNIGFRFNDEFGKPYVIQLTTGEFTFGDEEISLDPKIEGGIRDIQFFFDRTVIEIYVNEGLACATKVVYPDMDNLNFEIFSTDKKAVVKNLDIWEMKSIW